MQLPNFSALSLRACQRPTGRPVDRPGGGPNPAGLNADQPCALCMEPLDEIAEGWSMNPDPQQEQLENSIIRWLGWNNKVQQLEQCGHQFHLQCIARHAQFHTTAASKCPTCNAPIEATERNWLQTVTVPKQLHELTLPPTTPTQPDWRDISRQLHGESTRREPPGPLRDLNDNDYEAAKRFIERKLRQNLDRSADQIVAQMVDVERVDGPGFGLINSGSRERLRALIRTTYDELWQERNNLIQSFKDDGTIFTLLLMQPEKYFEGMGRMPGGESRPDARLGNKQSRLGERVGNMLAALYPREFEPWWEPKNDSGVRIGTPDLLRAKLAFAASQVYEEVGEQRMRGPSMRTRGESVQRRVLRLLPDLRRLWANGAAHESQPHIGPGDRRLDGYKVLENHMQLRDEVLSLYHLTRGPNIFAWYAHRDNMTMSIEHKEDASDEFYHELDTLAARVVKTAREVRDMSMSEMRARENELLLPRLPDADGPMQFTFDDRPIDEYLIQVLLCQSITAEQLNERNYRRLDKGKGSWR